MAKITPEQKLINKEAAKLRDRAFNERKQAYQDEMAAMEVAIETSPSGELAKTTREALDAACTARNQEIDRFYSEIAALKEKLKQAEARHESIIEPLRRERESAWSDKSRSTHAAGEEIKSRYPDVADCWSAASWKDFKEFLPLVGPPVTPASVGSSDAVPSLREQQEHLADNAFELFEFGDGVSVAASDAWSVESFDGKDDWTKVVYVVTAGDDPEKDSDKVSLHVAFVAGTTAIDESYAYLCESGAEIGRMPAKNDAPRMQG